MVNWQRGVMRLMRITNHEVVVTGVDDLTGFYRRIHFRGPELLSQLSDVFPTLWVRLWFPHPEKGEGHLSQRGYTFVDVDVRSGEFSLDFVLHGSREPATDGDPGSRDELPAVAGPEADRRRSIDTGPACRWAANAIPGARIEAALTPARIDLPEDTSHVVLAGDLTALPAINSWLRAIPAEVRVSVAIEDHHDEVERLPRTDHPNVGWTWVRTGDAPGLELAEHLRGLGLLSDGLYVWAAGEKGLVKHVRSVIKQDVGLQKGQHFSQFYWFEGKATG